MKRILSILVLALIVIFVGMAIAEELVRLEDNTGTVTIYQTSSSAGTGTTTKYRITNERNDRTYDGFLAGFTLDTAVVIKDNDTVGINDSAWARVYIKSGQNGYTKTLFDTTVFVLPKTVTRFYSNMDASKVEGMYWDSLWMEVNYDDSAVGTGDSIRTTFTYLFRLIEAAGKD